MKKSVLVFIAILLPACGYQSQQDEDKMVATKLYDEVKSTNSPGSLYRVAESMRKAGNYEVALKSYEQAVQIDPTLTQARIGMSHCLRMTGRHEAALELLRKMPVENQSTSWYKELGATYTFSQKPKQCIEAYQKAHQGNPSDVGALNGMAVCHDLLGQHDQAYKLYTQAAELSPSNNNLKSNMGLSMALAGRTEEAIEILRAVVNEPDATARDRGNYAIALVLGGNLDEAVKQFSLDLGKEDVQKNLAFAQKLARTQNIKTAKKVPATSSGQSFETDLAAHASVTAPAPAPVQTQNQPDITMAAEPISRDTHVIVNPLPVADTTQETYAEPSPQETPDTTSSFPADEATQDSYKPDSKDAAASHTPIDLADHAGTEFSQQPTRFVVAEEVQQPDKIMVPEPSKEPVQNQAKKLAAETKPVKKAAQVSGDKKKETKKPVAKKVAPKKDAASKIPPKKAALKKPPVKKQATKKTKAKVEA
jgi:Flp pilus assembly protein TadD